MRFGETFRSFSLIGTPKQRCPARTHGAVLAHRTARALHSLSRTITLFVIGTPPLAGAAVRGAPARGMWGVLAAAVHLVCVCRAGTSPGPACKAENSANPSLT